MTPNTYTWYFQWTDNILELSNKTRKEAFRTAREFGWRPSVWYRPSTWGNFYIQG